MGPERERAVVIPQGKERQKGKREKRQLGKEAQAASQENNTNNAPWVSIGLAKMKTFSVCGWRGKPRHSERHLACRTLGWLKGDKGLK